jgi:hypothetical protein
MRTVRPTSWSQLANGPLMARTAHDDPRLTRSGFVEDPLTCDFALERVTGIEPALSAWEADVLPLNYTRAHCRTSLRCVRLDIVPEPVGCQGAPLRS